MSHFARTGLMLLSLFALVAAGLADETKKNEKPAVIALFEDDTDLLAKQFTSKEGQMQAEAKDKFSGTSCIRITPLQCYNHMIEGWAFPIAAKPEPGQYRYLRFAWKKLGGSGMMVQLSDKVHWERRSWPAPIRMAGRPSRLPPRRPASGPS